MSFMPVDKVDHHYACMICKTGSEQSIAETVMRLYPSLYVHPVRHVKHQSVKGIKTLREHTLLPGYVFISVPYDDGGVSLYTYASLPMCIAY